MYILVTVIRLIFANVLVLPLYIVYRSAFPGHGLEAVATREVGNKFTESRAYPWH